MIEFKLIEFDGFGIRIRVRVDDIGQNENTFSFSSGQRVTGP